MTMNVGNGTLSTKKKIYISKDINRLLEKKQIRFSKHANIRMRERNVLYFEVLQVLRGGNHISSRDRFVKKFNSWSYCIEGETCDQRLLRISISFTFGNDLEEDLIVITVIDLM